MIVKVDNIVKISGEWIVTFDISSVDGVNFDFITSVPSESITKTKAIKVAYMSSKAMIEQRYEEAENRHIDLIGLEIDNKTGDIIVEKSDILSEIVSETTSDVDSNNESLSVWEESEKSNSKTEKESIRTKPSTRSQKSKTKANKSEVA